MSLFSFDNKRISVEILSNLKFFSFKSWRASGTYLVNLGTYHQSFSDAIETKLTLISCLIRYRHRRLGTSSRVWTFILAFILLISCWNRFFVWLVKETWLYFLSLKELLSNKNSFSETFHWLWAWAWIFYSLVQIVYFTVEKWHGSVLGANSSEPTFLFNVFKSIDKTQISFLDIFSGLTQSFHFSFKYYLALHFQFFVLLVGNSSMTVKLL